MAIVEEVIQVLSLVIATISIVGNSLVCHIIIHTRSMKTVMHYLLLNLALVDAISGFLAICNIIIDGHSEVLRTTDFLEQVYNKSEVAAKILCKVDALFWFGGAVAPMILTAIAYERYMAVVHPLSRRAGGVSKARLKWILAFCWLSGIAFSTWDLLITIYTQGVCDITSVHWYNVKIHAAFLASIQFIIPSIAIFVLYLRVIKALRTKDEALGVQQGGQRTRNKPRRKLVLIIMTVTVIFYICCGIPQVLYFFGVIFEVKQWIHFETLSVLLFTVNSLANPLLYFSVMKTFRKRLLKLICKRRQETPQGSLVIINKFPLNRQNDASRCESQSMENTLGNEPKLLRISRTASSVLLSRNTENIPS